jgi:hypothetical protein
MSKKGSRLEKSSPTYLKLKDFIQNRMAMSHIYQPAMLIELLSSNGSSAVADIAKALLGRCQSKILNTWSGHRTAQIDPEKRRKINGHEIRF